MDKKKGFGFLLLIVSMGFILAGSFSITGFSVSQNTITSLNTSYIGFIMLLVSLLLMTSKNSLEAIVIPTGQRKENFVRARKGVNYYSNPETQYFIISGGRGSKKLRESERADIYRGLRAAGYTGKKGEGPEIKPSQMIIEGKSKDTLENVLYSLRKLRPGTKQIDFVSYPGQLDRFKLIIEKARKEGLVPEGLKVKYIPTHQNLKEFVYGILALAKEKYRLRNGIKEAEKHKTGKLGNLAKKVIG